MKNQLLDELIEILTPLEMATNFAQAQNQVTASIVLPCIRGLRAELATLREKFNGKLVSSLAASVDKRLSKYESIELFTLAASLDPRWKLMWATREEAATIRQTLVDKVSSTQPDITAESTTNDQPSPAKRSKLFRFMGDSPPATNTMAATPSAESQM